VSGGNVSVKNESPGASAAPRDYAAARRVRLTGLVRADAHGPVNCTPERPRTSHASRTSNVPGAQRTKFAEVAQGYAPVAVDVGIRFAARAMGTATSRLPDLAHLPVERVEQRI
jgi:hypothetical protein